MSSCGNRQPRNGLSRAHEFPSALNMVNLTISCIPFRTVRTDRPLFAVRSSRHFDHASRAASGPPTSNTRELTAPAVAITLRCDGCIAVHLAAAGKPGATREEIAEALGVGISVNAGAALVYSARTLDAFDAAA
jgi:AhpD family alkylhydroperoxidase